MSAGFLTVFIAVGLISVHFTQWINRNARYATVMIGVALVVLGVAMLFGYKLPISTPAVGRRRPATHGRVDVRLRRRLRGGVDRLHDRAVPCHAVGEYPLRRGAERVANVVPTARGWRWSSPPSPITLAVANTGLLRVLRTGMRHVESIAAVFVVLSGLYLVYYFWVVDVNEDRAPITDRSKTSRTGSSCGSATTGRQQRSCSARSSPPRSCTCSCGATTATTVRRQLGDAPATGLPSPP